MNIYEEEGRGKKIMIRRAEVGGPEEAGQTEKEAPMNELVTTPTVSPMPAATGTVASYALYPSQPPCLLSTGEPLTYPSPIPHKKSSIL